MIASLARASLRVLPYTATLAHVEIPHDENLVDGGFPKPFRSSPGHVIRNNALAAGIVFLIAKTFGSSTL